MGKVAVAVGLGLLSIIGFILVLGLTHQPSIEIPENMAGKHIEIDGLKVRYVQLGNGPDILFVHGALCSIEDFMPIAQELSKKYKVTIFDRPGCGFSEVDEYHYSLEGNASIVKGIIEKLDLDNPLIVGHSHGTSVLATFAVRYPQYAKGYVFMGVCVYPDKVIPFKETTFSDQLIAKVISLPVFGTGVSRIILPLAGKDMLRDSFTQIFKPGLIPDGYMETGYSWSLDPRCLVTLFRNSNDYDKQINTVYEKYPQIKQKISIIQGEQDYYTDTVPGSQLLAKEIKKSKLTMLPDTGHMIYFQHREIVLKVINDFDVE